MALAQTDNATLDHPLGDLIVWAKEHGAYIHPLLELRKDPVKGWSFRILPAHMWPPSEKTANSQDQVSIPVNHAVYEIPASTPIVTCPYAVSLSYLNAAGLFGNPSRNLAPDFPASFLKVVGAHAPSVVGNFFLMQQYLLGPRSFWYPYIRNLPQPDQAGRVGTPIFWPEEDLRYLTGTNLEPALKQQDDLWRQQWADAAKFLEVANYHHWEIYTYELYKWAASIFGSRSFRASLTIPLELVSSPDADTGHIYQEHIRADNFSVLLPLLDIGNHNGLNNVEWHEQPEEKCFQLRTRHGIQAGVELYNFYGDKTNSELLMAYGFMLPSPEPIDRDSVNLMVKFSEEHLNLWQGLHCFVPDNSSTQIIGKRIFTVQRIRQRNPELLGDSTPLQQDTRIEELRPFSDGLVDILMIISANEQESQYIAANTSICPERSPNLLAGPLVRVAIQVLSILRFKLEQELYRIQDANTGLGNPQNSNQRLAMDFRNRQISVLQAALDPITFRLRSLLNRTSLWGNGASYTYISQGRENQGLSLVTDSHLEPLSLECAYGWLRTNYPGVSEWIEERIACDQDELLPLNWANIAGENWEYVYFTLWVFILLAIWAREPEFSSNHLMLATWLHEVNQ
ncbi:hypothetical protein F5884DRAFT_32276 [Xylogone sp. PMI_703]|nr:hypothetical protein F5884DRAFT_32276 [Xylogone sp. PMI_703]